MFEDTKGVIRIRKSKRDKRTNDDQQNITQKTKDRVTRTPSIIGDELRCSGSASVNCVLHTNIPDRNMNYITHKSVL